MDAELMRTVRTLEVDDYQDSLEDPIGHHERAKAGFKRLSRNSVEKLFSLRAATVAEYRKRRAESPWKGPFFAQRGARTGEEGPEWNGMWEVADRQIEWVCERSECDEAETIAAALNAYYGYDAQGNDVLEGL